MAAWETAIITNKGCALLAKLSSGNSLYLTRAVSGAGYVDPSALPDMTGVTDQRQDLKIGIQNYTEDGLCNVPILLTNEGVSTSYTAKQVGIFATDPDDGEILFLISQARSGEGTSVPAESDIPGFSAEWTFSLRYGQADGVSITVDPANTVTVTEAQHMIDNTISEKLGNVNNTPDSEKYVLYSGTSGEAEKVKNTLTIRLNGGRTEGTDMWTFDGSTSRSVNITPKSIGIETKDGTVTSQNADYAEVGQWADGNASDEDRIGYFVSVDPATAGTTMVKATSTMDVRGVTVSAPAFSCNCAAEKFDENGNLLKQYDYVAVMGLVSVIDNGTCTINGRCMPADDGTAIPSTNNMGYQVIDRIDSTHVLIAVEPGADMIQRIKNDVTELENTKANTSYVDAAKAEANAYTDTAKAEANAYTDTAKAEAKSYTDSKRITKTATITTTWSGSGPYTQRVSVSGILASDMPHITPVYSTTNSTAIAQKEAWSCVSKAVTAAGKITFTCFEDKPTTAIPIQIEVIR